MLLVLVFSYFTKLPKVGIIVLSMVTLIILLIVCRYKTNVAPAEYNLFSPPFASILPPPKFPRLFSFFYETLFPPPPIF